MTEIDKGKFDAFDLEHPEIWKRFEKFTFETISSGKKHYSARAVFHRLRWETEIDEGGQFKLSNKWSRWYSRKFMETYPHYNGFFRTRGEEFNLADFEAAARGL